MKRGILIVWILVAAAAPIGMPSAAAAPREGIEFANVVSWGEAGDIHNVLADRSLAGGYAVRSMTISGVLRELATGTFASDARLFLSAPNSQGSVVIQPFGTDAFAGTVSVSLLRLDAPDTWVQSTGTWRVRLYEAFADSTSGPDSIWDSVTIGLDDGPLPPPATLVASNNEYAEVEGNSDKSRANRISAIVPGQRITGSSRGTSLVGGDETTCDYFEITTASATQAIFRHRLVLTSFSSGHTLSLRGLSQSMGFAAPGSDVAVQTASAATQPARFVQWFGFGHSERIIARVGGTAASIEPYTLTYSREDVTFNDLGDFRGEITLTTHDQVGIDTDLWLYDSQFHAISGAGNDDSDNATQSTLNRSLEPGVYYVALSDYNLANDQTSPADDESRSGPVLEFTGALLNSSAAMGLPLNLRVDDSFGRSVVAASSKGGPFDVVFHRFEVLAPCAADLSGALGEPDGAVTIDDLLWFLEEFERGAIGADLDDGSGSGFPDGGVTIDDLLYFLIRFEAGC